MNDGTSNHESDESDDFSSSSDEIRVNPQIQQIENNFDDIDDFWSNTKATPHHASISIGNSGNSPRITFPTKSPNNQIFYQPTPPRFSQKSISKFSNSPIYVSTSTEDTPYRYNSKRTSVSSDYSGIEDSSSSDDITFIDTPITDKSKSPAFSNPKEIFKLSPIVSNKNESNKENDSSENNHIDSSSSESEISVLQSNSKEPNLNSPHDSEIVNESNNNSNFPLPPFSFSNSSDSESSKDQNNDNRISQTRNNKEKDFTVSSNKKNKSNSKPAFASPKKVSSCIKEETIITELSPSSKRNKIECKKMPNFRLSHIDDDDIENEKINQHEIKEEDNKKSGNEDSTIVQENNQKEFSDDNDSDDIKKIEKLAKKDPFHKKKMDDLITDYNLSKKEQCKSPSKKEIKSNDETEPKTRKAKSTSKSKNNQQKLNSEPKSKNKPKSKSKEDTENENKPNKNKSNSKSDEYIENENKPNKNQSKSKEKTKQKQKSSVQSNSQQKSKADSKSKSPTKSSSQPSKTRIKKASKLHYDFNDLSDDSDEERISALVQIPDQKEEKSNKDDSAVNDNNDDLPIALRRRKRVIVKPLKFWCGEHIVYGLSEDGFQTFQNVSIPEKLKKLKKGENRVMPKGQKRIPAKGDCERKLTRVEGNGLVVFKEKVVDFDKSYEVILKKGEKCNVACKGESPLIFKIEDI